MTNMSDILLAGDGECATPVAATNTPGNCLFAHMHLLSEMWTGPATGGVLTAHHA